MSFSLSSDDGVHHHQPAAAPPVAPPSTSTSATTSIKAVRRPLTGSSIRKHTSTSATDSFSVMMNNKNNQQQQPHRPFSGRLHTSTLINTNNSNNTNESPLVFSRQQQQQRKESVASEEDELIFSETPPNNGVAAGTEEQEQQKQQSSSVKNDSFSVNSTASSTTTNSNGVIQRRKLSSFAAVPPPPKNSRPSSAQAVLAAYQNNNSTGIEDDSLKNPVYNNNSNSAVAAPEGKSTEKKSMIPAPPTSSNSSSTIIPQRRKISLSSFGLSASASSSLVHHHSHHQTQQFQDNQRRFFAIETSARSQIFADESDSRSVMMQWFSAMKYQDREKQSVKMRIPRSVVASISPERGASSRSHQEEREQQEQQEHQQRNVTDDEHTDETKYVSYTEKTGRIWSTRPKNMIQENENNRISNFEQKLLQSKFAEAFEIDDTLLPQKQTSDEQRRQHHHHLQGEDHPETDYSSFTHHQPPSSTERRQHQKQQQDLVEEETNERQIFIATIFLPEVFRCVEDGERIERAYNEERRRQELNRNLYQNYQIASKPFVEKWRKREHATLTIQCAFRKIQRESFGWRRTHKQIGYEIETERRKRKAQEQEQQKQEREETEQQQQQQQRRTSSSTNPRSSIMMMSNQQQQQKQQTTAQASSSSRMFSSSLLNRNNNNNSPSSSRKINDGLVTTADLVELVEDLIENDPDSSLNADNLTTASLFDNNTNNNVSLSAASVRMSKSIANLELEERRAFLAKQKEKRAVFLKSVCKARDDAAYEEKWVLQRELQHMASRFFDDVTKPGMARVAKEETKERIRLMTDEHEEEYNYQHKLFCIVRDQIQEKNDLEKVEGEQRNLLDISRMNHFAAIGDARDVDLEETIRKVLMRFKLERQSAEKDELMSRQEIDKQMIEDVSELYAWHCSIIDDSLFVQERRARNTLIEAFYSKINAWFQHGLYGSKYYLELDGDEKLEEILIEGEIDSTRIVFETLGRKSLVWAEEDSRKWLMASITPQAVAISAGSDKRVDATRRIQKFWRLYKLGQVGRTGRLKFYDRVFAVKKKAAAQKKMRKMIEQTQQDLENALKAANIHIVAGFSQKTKLLEKQEARGRQDIETDDALMRRIFDANMVSAIASTCTNETTVLTRFEAYHRFELQKQERDIFAKYKTYMELVFVKDVKIRPAQRAIRCHLARNARRERIKEALLETRQKEQQQRTQMMIDQMNSASDVFAEKIIAGLYRVSFANATFVWIQEQERAARQIINDERDLSSRGYLGWLASLNNEAVTEEQHNSFKNNIIAEWKVEMNSLDLFSLEISERKSMISHQSELATKNLLSHIENMQRLFTAQTAERHGFELAVSSLELNESTNRTAIEREAINMGFSLLLHKQESAQRSILQRHLLKLLSSNSAIQQEESEARDEIVKGWSAGILSWFNTLEQNSRFSVMMNEHLTRDCLRFFSSEDDWRRDTEATRRYEMLMLVELAEQSSRKTFLNREMKCLENIVDFNRSCIVKKGLMFEKDFCHGVRAILEVQQHEQRKLLAQDERDHALDFYRQHAVANQFYLMEKETRYRAKMFHYEHAKFDWIVRYHTKLVRNENFRDADNAWRSCAARAVYAVDRFKDMKEKQKLEKQQQQNAASPTKQLEQIIEGDTTATGGPKSTSLMVRKQQQHNRELVIRAMHNELLRVMSQFLMPLWQRQMALELSSQYLQLIGEQITSSHRSQIEFVESTMESALSRDPYYQTMFIIRQRNLVAKEMWSEQSNELVQKLSTNIDAWVLPFYESTLNTASRVALSEVKELEARELHIEFHEESESKSLFQQEYVFRNTISITENERSARSDIQKDEVKEHSDIIIEYQDSILKPLEVLRHEKQLRRKIQDESELVARAELVKQFEDEYLYQIGPQRAWTLCRRQEELRVRAQKIHEPTFLDLQEQQAKRRTEFESIKDDQERKNLAIQYLQKWAQRKLWMAGATRTDKQFAAAFAVTDVLHKESFAAIDVRDRFEKLCYSAILIQKLFRGYRARHPNFGKRIEATRIFKENERKKRQMELDIVNQQLSRQRHLVEREENSQRARTVVKDEKKEFADIEETYETEGAPLLVKYEQERQQQEDENQQNELQKRKVVEQEESNTQRKQEEEEQQKKAAAATKEEEEHDEFDFSSESNNKEEKTQEEKREAKKSEEEANIPPISSEQPSPSAAPQQAPAAEDESEDLLGDLSEEL